MHVHARKDRLSAKIWINPVQLAWSQLNEYDTTQILKIVEEHRELIEIKWNEHFNQ